MGYDPRFRKYSPGLMILMHSLEECFDPDQRASKFDLGWGDRQYKRSICNQSWKDGPMYLYAPSLRGVLLNCSLSLASFADVCARKLLHKSSFLKKARRGWQQSLRRAGGEKPSAVEYAGEEDCHA
jgi:CelD/BcsL family acetyltransferase involved in cellulose biosynthesis